MHVELLFSANKYFYGRKPINCQQPDKGMQTAKKVKKKYIIALYYVGLV